MLLEMAAEGAGDRVVVGSRVGGLAAPQLLACSQRAAAMFVERGAAHVGMVDVNSEAVPIAMFGAALAGVPFAPVNYRLTDDKLESILRRPRARRSSSPAPRRWTASHRSTACR